MEGDHHGLQGCILYFKVILPLIMNVLRIIVLCMRKSTFDDFILSLHVAPP